MRTPSFIDPEDPTHSHSREGVAWSRVNERGALPGVCTPLNWSIWGEAGERAVRRGNHLLGVLSRAECAPAERVGDRVWSIFYGRPTANVDTWRWLSSRTPGRSGAESDETNFGQRREVRDREEGPRWLTAAWRLPRAAAILPGRMRVLRARSHAFWRDSLPIAAEGAPEAVLRRFREAVAGFEAADVWHIAASMLANLHTGQIQGVARDAGRPGLAGDVLAGLPNLEEHETSVALWRVAREGAAFDGFLARNGFRGPAEGEIASRSWREVPGPLEGLIETVAGVQADRDPRNAEQERVARALRARAALLAPLSPAGRVHAVALLASAKRLFPWREVGKASLILHLDAARACARRLGALLEASGRLTDAEDVFFLLAHEIDLAGADLRERVVRRRARHAEFEALELPDAWVGMPETRPADLPAVEEEGEILLQGLGIGGGSREGRVVVVDDPARFGDDFREGDVLVADSTDPSWAPFFMVAGAVVMDAGSAISHAAIVAREMGIPAVVATGDATTRLRTGWRVRVDGDAGEVRVVSRG